MRSCLKALCACAAQNNVYVTGSGRVCSNRNLASIAATAVFSVLFFSAAGCADSNEPNDRAGSMRVTERASDDAGPVVSPSDCDGGECDESWLCPVDDRTVSTATVLYSVRVVDFADGMPRADLKAKACRLSDLSCDKPVASFVDSEHTGQVKLMLPSGFTGFFELTSDGLDTLLYVMKPIVKDTVDRDVTVPTPDSVLLLASLLEYTWDMDRGLVVLDVLDCSNNLQTGVHFDCREGGDPFYLVDGIPFKSEQLTTSDTAEGGFLNVPTGMANFSAQLGIEEDAMSLGSLTVQIRPHTLTIVDMQQH